MTGHESTLYGTSDGTNPRVMMPSDAMRYLRYSLGQLRNPEFLYSEYIRQHEIIHDEQRRNQARLTPRNLAQYEFEDRWGGRGWKGPSSQRELQDLANIGLDDVQDFHHRLYRPNRMTIILAGKVDHLQAVKVIAGIMDSMEPGEPPVPHMNSPQTLSFLGPVPTREGTEKQADISLRFQAPQRDHNQLATYSLSHITKQILDQALFTQLRTKRNLVYTSGAGLVCDQESRVYGIDLGFGCHVDRMEEIRKNLLLVIDEVMKDPAPLLKNSLRQQTRGLEMASPNGFACVDWMRLEVSAFGRPVSLAERLKTFASISSQDISTYLKEMFSKPPSLFASAPETALAGVPSREAFSQDFAKFAAQPVRRDPKTSFAPRKPRS